MDDRLTKEELDLRVAQALASRTRADLAAVTADMPKAGTAKKSTAKVRTARVRAAGVGVTGAVAVAVTMVLVLVLVLVTSIPQAGFLGGRCRRRASRSISPSSAPSWRWTTCTPAPLGSGYGKITNIVQPRLSLRSLITARADGRIRLGTGLGESRALVNKIISGMLAGACVLIVGCSSPAAGHSAGPASSATVKPGASTYVCSGSTMGELLKWQNHNGGLSGTFRYTWMDGHAPTEGITSISADLSGTLKGTAISLNLGFSHPLHGRLSGGHFSLNLPQPNGTTKMVTCRPASMADWNKKVAALYNQVNEDNNRPTSPAGG